MKIQLESLIIGFVIGSTVAFAFSIYIIETTI